MTGLSAAGPILHPKEVQKKPSPDVPLGPVDYLELKAMETLWAQEKMWPLP